MRIVGSMTTIPDRIFDIEKVIDSILNQSRPLDCLYLNIPVKSLKGIEYKIPDWVSKKKNLILNRCDEDYGPITKLLPVLDKETDPDTYITTFDDDRILHKDVVRIIESYINKYPDCVFSFSGWNTGSFPFYFERCDDNEEDQDVDWVQGCHSITYPRKVLNKNKLKYVSPIMPSFMERHDDHQISSYLEKNKIRKISIGKNAEQYFEADPCCEINAISGGNSWVRKLEFFSQVVYLGYYFRSKGLYYRSYGRASRTSTFKTVVVFCVFFLIVLPAIVFKKIFSFSI